MLPNVYFAKQNQANECWRCLVCCFSRHWCNRTREERVDRVLSPRLQLEVSCSEVYQYDTHGWRLDVDRMRVRHGGDDGIALYYSQQGPKASCFLYK